VTGTGVGLYLAYHLTVLHGGTISVASRKGKGSTFTVRLPRKM
jgi:signal transduction histidine kinase